MSHTIQLWSNIQIVGGPKVSISREMTVEAYDKIKVKIGADASDKEVEIQPGGTAQVQMLLVKANKYDSNKLTYKVHETSDDAITITLDQEQLFLGKGAVGLLGDNLDKLFFTNNLSEEVEIEILVGRDATPGG